LRVSQNAETGFDPSFRPDHHVYLKHRDLVLDRRLFGSLTKSVPVPGNRVGTVMRNLPYAFPRFAWCHDPATWEGAQSPAADERHQLALIEASLPWRQTTAEACS
jgi:hypothetical protein